MVTRAAETLIESTRDAFNLRELWITCDRANAASAAMARRLGFEPGWLQREAVCCKQLEVLSFVRRLRPRDVDWFEAEL